MTHMMITDEMVERGAEAIFNELEHEPAWDDLDDGWGTAIERGREHYRNVSRACLGAVFPKPVRHDDGTVWLGDKMIGIAHPSLTDF